jgi:hypothetical protein
MKRSKCEVLTATTTDGSQTPEDYMRDDFIFLRQLEVSFWGCTPSKPSIQERLTL